MRPCKEVERLRLGDASVVPRLVAKYRRGRRSAVDVCQALAALRARNDRAALNELWLESLRAVYLAPLCLFTWGMDNADLINYEAMAYALRRASYARRLEVRVPLDRVCATADGALAAMQDRHFRGRVTSAMLSRLAS